MKHLLLALAIGLTAIGCRDKETEPQDQLPPITQHGANTAGAVVNGKVMIPKNRIAETPGSGISYGLLLRISRNENNPSEITKLTLDIRGRDYTFFVELDTINIPKDYYTTDFENGIGSVYGKTIPYVCVTELDKNGVVKKFYYSDKNTCKITFSRIDLQSGIISGTFSGKVYNEQDKNDKIEIKDGRFDINRTTLNK